MAQRPYLVFVLLATLLFCAATLGSDIVARTSISGESVTHALSEHIHYALIQPVGTLFLATPFLLLAWLSASLAARKGFKPGLVVFLLGAFALEVLYFSGYHESQAYIQRRMWTASTLSIGFLPFKSLPMLLVCLCCRWYLGRKVSAPEA